MSQTKLPQNTPVPMDSEIQVSEPVAAENPDELNERQLDQVNGGIIAILIGKK